MYFKHGLSRTKENARGRTQKYRNTAKGKRMVRQYYEMHKAYFRQKCNSYRRNTRAFLWEYKTTHPCVVCGESDPRCLQFHHRGEKTGTLGSDALKNGWGVERCKRELEHCVVLCANCHMKEHDMRPGKPRLACTTTPPSVDGVHNYRSYGATTHVPPHSSC